MDNSSDVNVKKSAFDDLSKEELIAKCKNLLVIAQRAKQSKDGLIEENNKLKEQLQKHENLRSEEIIGKLTQQKVDLLTNLEELKSDKSNLDKKISQYKIKLQDAETKISDLDVSNESYKRRVDRLTEENEQLIGNLDDLEKQIEELKRIGLYQQQQLLALEKNNLSAQASDSKTDAQVIELQRMLSTSLEEVKRLKSENDQLSNTLVEVEACVKDNETKMLSQDSELLEKNKIIESLQIELTLIEEEKTKGILEISEYEEKFIELQNELSCRETIINTLKQDLNIKNADAEKNVNLVDDLKTEVHKNKALVEKLKNDITNVNHKLSDSQIMSSGVTSDLENANGKLRDKLKSYHTKLIKFATDIKLLKQSKVQLLSTFRTYTMQVSEWKEQLHLLLEKIKNQENESYKIKSENQLYQEIISKKTNENALILEELTIEKRNNEEENEKLKDVNKSLKDEINLLRQKLDGVEQELLCFKERENSFVKNIQDLQDKCNILQEKALKEDSLVKSIQKLEAGEGEATAKIEKLLIEKAELNDQYNECCRKVQDLCIENDNLKSQVDNLNKEVEDLKEGVLENGSSLDSYKKEIANLSEEYAKMKNEKEIAESNITALQEEHENLKKQNLEDRTTLESTKQASKLVTEELKHNHETEKHTILLKCTTFENELAELNKRNIDLQKTVDVYLQEKKELNEELDEIKLNLSDLYEKYEESQDLKTIAEQKMEIYEGDAIELQELNERLREQCDMISKHEKHFVTESGKEIAELMQERDQLMKIIKELEHTLNDLTCKSFSDTETQTENDMYNMEAKTNSLKRDNSELLTEMNQMNQELKERGETISIQETQYEDLLRKYQAYEVQFKSTKDAISKKDELIENLKQELQCVRDATNTERLNTQSDKEDETNRLKFEIQELKDKLFAISQSDMQGDYAESENMSTSTISKAEEANRMKDLDSSWEERYGKLRNLALKLKGRIRDLTADLQKEQAEKNELSQKNVKTIQTFQQQVDRLQDDLEMSKVECREYAKKLDVIALDVSRDKRQLAENEEIISQLKSEIERLNKEKTNTENWKKQVSAKIQALKKEQEANGVLKKDFESRINKLNAELENKEKALKQEIEKHNQTKAVLQESNNECKKQSVLNLEMHDYERSVKDLSQKIEKKQELINKLKDQLDMQKTSLNALKDQNQDLEESIKSWEDKYDKISRENDFNRKKMNELEDVLSERDSKIQELTYMIENSRSDNEDLSTQLSKTITEHQKAYNALKEECDNLRSQNISLTQSLRKVQEELKMKEQLFAEIQAEYEGYKVRAQSVLRQNNNRDISAEEKLSEEAATLKAQVDILSLQVKELRTSLVEATSNNGKLQQDCAKFLERIKALEQSAENDNKNYEQLNMKHQQILSEHAETIRGLKVHADTLVQCYRQQLSEQESRFNQEIIELQSKIDKGNSPLDSSLIIPSMPREEGEGSESVDSNPNNGIQPVSLEKLLNNDTEIDVISMRKQLFENESKVAHLTALLADTEQDLAKFQQLNKVLKEEIRRQQRSAEREKHAENLEYLKNVVFKFITLGSGDEKTRLVPVLNTILKLSPEETQKLNNVAKGAEKGWSNYLPMSWGSSSKPQ